MVTALVHALIRQLDRDYRVHPQNAIQLDDFTLPQPDLAVVTKRSGAFAHEHPHASDVQLVIEVADSSLAFDRKEILPRYAHAAIPEVWIVNIPEQCIQQYIDPHQGKYRFTKVIFANEAVMCERLGVIVNVADVFEGF